MKKNEAEVRNVLGLVERRSLDEAQPADSNVLPIRGVPIVFDSPTDIGGYWEETIAPEAIDDETLRDVRLLINHDMNGIPLARSRRNTPGSTMRLVRSATQIDMDADLDARNPKALEVNSAIDRQDVSGMSFAFYVDKDEWRDLDTDYPKRRILHISEIREISIVTYPAYEQTSISTRSLESGKESLAEARKALESAKERSAKIAELNNKLDSMKSEV